MSHSIESSFRDAIEHGLKNQLDRAREEVIAAASKDFAERVRKAVGQFAVNISSLYSVENTGTQLVIRVHLDKTEAPKSVLAQGGQ